MAVTSQDFELFVFHISQMVDAQRVTETFAILRLDIPGTSLWDGLTRSRKLRIGFSHRLEAERALLSKLSWHTTPFPHTTDLELGTKWGMQMHTRKVGFGVSGT